MTSNVAIDGSDVTSPKGSLADRLAVSKRSRLDLLERLGTIPVSILKLGRGKLSRTMFSLQHERARHANAGSAREKLEALRDAGYMKTSTTSTKKNGRGTLNVSIMPAELVEFFVAYYATRGDTYLDPFMGQGVQLQVAHAMGLDYWGYDASREYVSFITQVVAKIDDGQHRIMPFLGDSRDPREIPDGIGDVCFTSPPYWDIEFYGDESAQLGLGKTYAEFLQGIEAVARAWHPKFKRDAYVVVNVADFRKDKRFYAYSADTIAAFCRAGYTTHDVWIIDGLVGGMARSFAVSFNEKRIAPRVHEYALVFRP